MKKYIHESLKEFTEGYTEGYKKAKAKPKCKLTKKNQAMVVEGIKVHKNAEINAFGLYYAATTYLPIVGHRIIVDNNFYALPEAEQTAVLYHELGHIKYRHLSKGFYKKMWISLTKGKLAIRRFEDELEADAYAYEYEPKGTKDFLKRMATFNSEAKQRYEILIGDKITPFEILFGIDFKNINTVNLDEIE